MTEDLEKLRLFLFPRICPLFCLGKNDINKCVKKYGKTNVINIIQELLSENYDFPYIHHGAPRPEDITNKLILARHDCGSFSETRSKTVGEIHRASRLDTDTKKLLQGEIFSVRDSYSIQDWRYDSWIEPSRMLCWRMGSTLKKSKKSMTDDVLSLSFSPLLKYRHKETLNNIIDNLISEINEKDESEDVTEKILTPFSLRNSLIDRYEFTGPNMELYLYTLIRIGPKNGIYVLQLYHTFVIPVLVEIGHEIPSWFNLQNVEEETSLIVRNYLKHVKKQQEWPREGTPTEDAEIVLIEVSTFETHSTNGFLKSLEKQPVDSPLSEYGWFLEKRIFEPIRNSLAYLRKRRTKESGWLLIVTPLRESTKYPTNEPMLLYIMASKMCRLVGTMISKNRDYQILLFNTKIFEKDQDINWGEILSSYYHEDILKNEDKHKDKKVVKNKEINLITPIDYDENEEILLLHGFRNLLEPIIIPSVITSCQILEKTEDKSGNVKYIFGPQKDRKLKKLVETYKEDKPDKDVDYLEILAKTILKESKSEQ